MQRLSIQCSRSKEDDSSRVVVYAVIVFPEQPGRRRVIFCSRDEQQAIAEYEKYRQLVSTELEVLNA